MYFSESLGKAFLGSLSLASLISAAPTSQKDAVNTTTCNGKTYVYEELAGYGYLASDARDKFGDTLGGIGSSVAFDQGSWRREGKSYKGLIYCLPDRGYNNPYTLHYINRVHKIEVTLTPDESATASNPSGSNLKLKYLDSILFTSPNGSYTSGLDAAINVPYDKFSKIPVSVPSTNYPGNGYGGKGPGGNTVTIDSEGLFLGHDGSFWVSDEYGPYIYHLDPKGKIIGAIRPPDAIIPMRNGTTSFSADSPPVYNHDLEPEPHNNPTGRNNNQGFEGMTTNPDGTKLYVLLQSATNQDGGLEDGGERNTRFLIYDITKDEPEYEAEYVVQLPFVPGDDDPTVAKQSEIHYISDTQFLILARDSDAGRGQDDTQSKYRDVDIFDISKATNVKGAEHDCSSCQIASKKGNLRSGITPAQYCPWLDFNVNSQLKRFGVHNGGAQNRGLLNEKWESLALLPTNPGKNDGEYYLFSFSDNDFITQNGYANFGKYKYSDDSGYNLLNQALVFKVKLPAGAEPLVG